MKRRTLVTSLIAAGAVSATPWVHAQNKAKDARLLQRLAPSVNQRLIREKDDPPLLWAWGMNAVLNERNGASDDIYAGQAKTPQGHGEFRELLQEWWGCHNRQDALKTIDRLINLKMGQANYEKKLGATGR